MKAFPHPKDIVLTAAPKVMLGLWLKISDKEVSRKDICNYLSTEE